MKTLEKEERLEAYRCRTIDLPEVIAAFNINWKYDTSWQWAQVIAIHMDIEVDVWESVGRTEVPISLIIVKAGGNVHSAVSDLKQYHRIILKTGKKDN